VLSFFSLAVSSSSTVRDTGRQLGKDVHSLYGSPEALDQRVYKPLTSSSSMQTVDGGKTFEVRMSCNRQDDFLKVVILPNSRTSDVDTIRVYRDKNPDGTYQFSNSFNGPFAAVCTNGLLLCDAGSTTNCQGRRWEMSGGNLVLGQVASDLVGGCYCYNVSCGNDLLTNNREKVIEDIGLGIAHVLDDVYPRLSIGDHQVLSGNLAMTFSGQRCAAKSDCNDGLDNDNDGLIDHPLDPGCSSQTDPDETDLQSIRPEQHYGSPDGLGSAVDVANADTNSLFYKVNDLDISSRYSERSCRLSRQVSVESVLTFDSTHLSSDSFLLGTCGANCIEYTIGSIGDDTWSVYPGCATANHTLSFTVHRPDLIQSVHLFDVGYDDYTSVRLNDRIVWSDPTGWTGGIKQLPPCVENFAARPVSNPHGRFRGSVDVTNVFTGSAPGGQIRFDQTTYYMGEGEGWSSIRVRFSNQCGINENVSGNCSSLESDPECTLRQEVVDGVMTLDEYRATGRSPVPSERSFSSADGDCTQLIMRPWWKKERTYSCYAGRVNDLSFAADRYEKIHGSFDSDSGEFSDRRKDAQGTYQVHSETTSLPAADPQDCIQVCKTQKPRPGVSMGDVGAVGDSPAWDYSYYECDAGGNCPAPSNETVIEACGCGSSFKEAFLYMQMINQMKSDFLCTD